MNKQRRRLTADDRKINEHSEKLSRELGKVQQKIGESTHD